MARMGMDVDQVESAGKELKARSQEIDALVAKVDGIVRKLPGVWDGPDAQQFVNEWWPEHKKTLAHVSTSVAGLGQSALNNASQQREVSGSNGGGGLGQTLPSEPTRLLPVEPAPGSTAPGTLGAWNEADYRKFESESLTPVRDRNGNFLYNADQNGKAVDNCTAWAAWRWEQLHPGKQAPWGDGGQMAAGLNGTPQTPASLGALASYSEGKYGHVMVVEELRPDGSLRVSETNYNNSSAIKTDRVWVPQGKGMWKCGDMTLQISFSPA